MQTSPAPESALAKRMRSLPQPAQAKYERTRRAAIKAHAIVDGLRNEIESVREQRDAAMRDLGIHERRYPEGFTYEATPEGGRKRVPAQDPERDALAAMVEASTAELKRLYAEQQAVVVPDISGLTDWLLAQDPGAKFVLAAVPLPKLAKNETLAAVLERNLSDQRRAEDELATVRNAPRTAAEAKARMRDEVARLAARGRPEVDGLFHGKGVGWPTHQFIAGGHGAHQYAVTATVTDILGLFVWAHRDALIAALDQEIEAQGDDSAALNTQDQAARIVELEGALLLLQRQAEAVIDQLAGDGIPVRRTCTNPLVLLGIERAKS
jgi:hypothetical protein